jgi:hypothetical protein
VNRSEEFILVSEEEFDRTKTHDTGLVAFSNHDFCKILQLSTGVQTKEVILNDFESLTANGTFVASGDASNMSIDTTNFLNGASSLMFDVATGGTTAVITNPDMEAIDLTDYKGNSIFAYVYIPLNADLTKLTNFILKWGSDSSNYWSKTVTTTHENLAFQLGWNLLRFDWPTSSTGTPDVTATDYFQLTITKNGAMGATTGWHYDFLVARIGDIHSIVYYSKFAWQTTGTYAYKEVQTDSTDLLVADTTEFDLYVNYCIDIAGTAARLDRQERKENHDKCVALIADYRKRNPSERKLLTQNYHRSESIDGDFDVNNLNWNRRNGITN